MLLLLAHKMQHNFLMTHTDRQKRRKNSCEQKIKPNDSKRGKSGLGVKGLREGTESATVTMNVICFKRRSRLSWLPKARAKANPK